jgi:hypothetical protein
MFPKTHDICRCVILEQRASEGTKVGDSECSGSKLKKYCSEEEEPRKVEDSYHPEIVKPPETSRWL